MKKSMKQTNMRTAETQMARRQDPLHAWTRAALLSAANVPSRATIRLSPKARAISRPLNHLANTLFWVMIRDSAPRP